MSRVRLGENITIDTSKLLETRMLIQANSGGGKSYAIRKFLEMTHGHAQQIVLDMEGEFGTLREKYDFILAGKGGDIEASPKTAALLAQKVLELEVSLIVDLYELKKPERVRFVRNFIDALVNAPKECWHPVLVVIDEAHVFAPEKGESEAASAVIDLATRGRKRGFAAVLATQRLSKLNKDAAAECLNKLIGRTSLDIDRKRAADELGFTHANESFALRKLSPGEFYAFGPAISNDVTLGQIDSVQTSHPKAGQRLGFRRTKPTAHIKGILKKLTDLPKEVEAELRDKETLQRRIKELEIELKRKPVAERISIDPTAVEKIVTRYKRELGKRVLKLNYTIANAVGPLVRETIKDIDGLELKDEANRSSLPIQIVLPKKFQPVHVRDKDVYPDTSGETFGACEQAILGFLSTYPGKGFTKVQVGAMTGYSHGSGSFNNALSKLSKAGLLTREGGGILRLNPDADVSSHIRDSTHRLEDWIAKLGACERSIYQLLLSRPNQAWRKENIASETNYSGGSGSFNNALSRLNTLGLIKREHGGMIRINPEIQGL